jgi:hypothetical protein
MPRLRPIPVTFLSAAFIATGAIGLLYHATEFRGAFSSDTDLIWVLLLRLLAIAGGVFALRGANWARWLLLAWAAYHVVLSVGHSTSQVVAHLVVVAVVILVYFRGSGSSFFSGRSSQQSVPEHVSERAHGHGSDEQ